MIKNNCNHIVGIKKNFYESEEIIYHTEYINNKKKFNGEIYFVCPLCKNKIWQWDRKYKNNFGKYSERKYLGRYNRIVEFFKRIKIEWHKHNYGGILYVLKIAWLKSVRGGFKY